LSFFTMIKCRNPPYHLWWPHNCYLIILLSETKGFQTRESKFSLQQSCVVYVTNTSYYIYCRFWLLLPMHFLLYSHSKFLVQVRFFFSFWIMLELLFLFFITNYVVMVICNLMIIILALNAICIYAFKLFVLLLHWWSLLEPENINIWNETKLIECW
jgi:hypothetical protein